MNPFYQFFEEGFFHIIAFDAADHFLFILAFISIYDLKEWKQVLWIVTSFTIAHSVSLALSIVDLVHFNAATIEILIAGTIFITCLENLFFRRATNHRVIVTGFFGLIHGLGFSAALRSLFIGLGLNLFDTLVPFNLGIECGQLLIIVIILTLFSLIYKLTPLSKSALSKCISIPTLLISFYWMVIRCC